MLDLHLEGDEEDLLEPESPHPQAEPEATAIKATSTQEQAEPEASTSKATPTTVTAETPKGAKQAEPDKSVPAAPGAIAKQPAQEPTFLKEVAAAAAFAAQLPSGELLPLPRGDDSDEEAKSFQEGLAAVQQQQRDATRRYRDQADRSGEKTPADAINIIVEQAER